MTTKIHHQFSRKAPFTVFVGDLVEKNASKKAFILPFSRNSDAIKAQCTLILKTDVKFFFIGSRCLSQCTVPRYNRTSHDRLSGLNQEICCRIIFDQRDDQLTAMFHNAPESVN